MEDREIIELFFARDEQAIAALREKYGAHALALARSVTGSDQDAEECLSDACFSLWSAIPPAHPLHLGAYLLSAVRNGALTRLRAGMAAKRGGGCLEETYDELSEFLAAPDTPEQTLEAKELAREVERFLARSPMMTASSLCGAIGSFRPWRRSPGRSAAHRGKSKARCTAAVQSCKSI